MNLCMLHINRRPEPSLVASRRFFSFFALLFRCRALHTDGFTVRYEVRGGGGAMMGMVASMNFIIVSGKDLPNFAEHLTVAVTALLFIGIWAAYQDTCIVSGTKLSCVYCIFLAHSAASPHSQTD